MAVDALQDLSMHAGCEMILVDEQGAHLSVGARRCESGIAVTAQAELVARSLGGLLRDRVANAGRRGETENACHHARSKFWNEHPIHVLV